MQFLQECKDELSREAEKVHFVTLVFRTVACSQGITVTLLFSPHPDFNPVAIRASISGFSCYSICSSQDFTTTFPYIVPVFGQIVLFLLFNKIAVAENATAQRNQTKVYWLEPVSCSNCTRKQFLKVKVSWDFSLLSRMLLEGQCS